MAREIQTDKSSSRVVQIAAALVIVFALRYAKEVLIPIALAVLFTFLLAPLVGRLERRRVPRVPSVLIVVLMAFALIGSMGYIVGQQIQDLGKKLPTYAANIEQRARWVQNFTNGSLSQFSHEAEQIVRHVSDIPTSSQPANPISAWLGRDEIPKVQIVPEPPSVMTTIMNTVAPVLGMAANTFIIIVLCIFMLLQREDLRDRVLRLVSQGHLIVTTQAMDEAALRVSKYLLMQTIVNSIYGVCVAIGLLFLGIPNSMLWGLLAALLRFIPYVGPWLGAALPVALSLALPGSSRPLMTIGLFLVLELMCNSVLEPWLYGAHTGVSSIAILAAAVFWAWIWGGVGLLLATPLTVVLVVLGKYVPQMEFLSILLGDEPVFDPPTRYYQRLLASDPEVASELVDEYLNTQTLSQVYETVLIPALGLARRDTYRGQLEPEKEQFIREAMKDQVEELGDRPPPPPAETGVVPAAVKLSDEPTPFVPGTDAASQDDKLVQKSKAPGNEVIQILCLPARDQADEIAGMMFAQVLERSGYKAAAVSVTALASEMVELVAEKKIDIVVVSALPPSAVLHARYLCKRLRMRFPKLHLVVGLWTARGDLDRAKGRISCSPDDPLVSTFSDGLNAIQQLTYPILLSKSEATRRAVELANPLALDPQQAGEGWKAESMANTATTKTS